MLPSNNGRLIVDWVIKAWQAIPAETVANSIKACGVSLPVDASKDVMTSCFKEGKKCADGRALLHAQSKILTREAYTKTHSK